MSDRAAADIHAYCTYFDSGYLARGLALIESLRAHGDASPVWIMALDDAAHDYLAAASLPGVEVLRVDQLEKTNPTLAAARAERSRMEGYFTTTPLLIRWVMDRYEEPTTVIYLDADLYFFDSPQLVLDSLGSGSVGIIEHRYSPQLAKRLNKYGRFNVGWVGFRADADGRACLAWWGSQTLEWCRDTPDDGRYADQGYLDQFPALFSGVKILQPRGFNLAPWNTAEAAIATDSSGRVTVDGDPLVFFHFHALRLVGRWWISSQLLYNSLMGSILRDRVYEPYVRRIEAWTATVRTTVTLESIAKRGVGLRGLVFAVVRRGTNVVAIATRTAVRSGS